MADRFEERIVREGTAPSLRLVRSTEIQKKDRNWPEMDGELNKTKGVLSCLETACNSHSAVKTSINQPIQTSILTSIKREKRITGISEKQGLVNDSNKQEVSAENSCKSSSFNEVGTIFTTSRQKEKDYEGEEYKKLKVEEDLEREEIITKMRIMNLNVAGVMSAVKKGFIEYIDKAVKPDVICLQETKLNNSPISMDAQGKPNTVPFCWKTYPYQYWACSQKRRGYSGVSIISKKPPINSITGVSKTEFDVEGRCVTVEYPNFYLISCYAPNSGSELKRLPYKRDWSYAVEKLLLKLKSTGKGVIITGDMNVARTAFDLARPKPNEGHAGFTKEEREDIERVIESVGLIDVYRKFHPDTPGYTYFSYRANSRANNVGWRLDYFMATDDLLSAIKNCQTLDAKTNDGKWVSDHVPLILDLEF